MAGEIRCAIGRSGEAPRLCNNPPNHSKTQWCNTRVQIRNTAPENHTHMHTGQTSCAAPLCPSLTAPRPLSMVPAGGMLCRIGTDKAALPRSSSCPIGSNRMGLRLSRRFSRLDLASISPQSRLFAHSLPHARVEIIELGRHLDDEAHHISGDTWMMSVSGACLCAMSSSCFVNLRFSPSSSSHRFRVLTNRSTSCSTS